MPEPATIYSENEYGLYTCNYCGRDDFKTSSVAGRHFSDGCSGTSMSKTKRKKLLKTQKNRRQNTSKSAIESRHTYEKTVGGKAAKKRYQGSTGGIATRDRHEAKPQRKLKKQLNSIRHLKNNPQKLKAFLEKKHLLGKKNHRISLAKHLNRSFSKVVLVDHSELRNKIFEKLVSGNWSESDVKKLLARIKASYKVEDSTSDNYVYCYCDPTTWDNDISIEEFFKTIFYIGRGTNCRFVDHAREVQTMSNEGTVIDAKKMPKQAKIADIWKAGLPVKAIVLNLGKFAELTDFMEFATTFACDPNLVAGGAPNRKKILTNRKYDGASSTPISLNVKDVLTAGFEAIKRVYEKRGDAFDCYKYTDYGEKPVFTAKKR